MFNLDQNYNQGLQQGLDRISSLLQERSMPKTSDFGMDSQSMGIPTNMGESLLIDAIASNIASRGKGGKSYNQFAQDYVNTQRKNQMEDANSMLAVLKEQAALGDKESKDFHDVLQMVVGKDPMKQAQIIQELDQNPDFHSISNPNRTQMLTFGTGAAKKLGLSNTDYEMEKAKLQTDIDYKRAMISQANAKSSSIATPKAKPMPASAVKLQNEALDMIGTAKNIQTDLGNVINAIDSGKLDLGLFSNAMSRGRNYLGYSTEESRNYQTFMNTLEKLRNDSLRLNKGVQTEGDSERAWNEIVTNINDPKLVRQRLKEVQQINNRAANLKMIEVDLIRQNFGADPMDYSGYNSTPAILTSNEPMSELPDPMQHSGRTITDTDTGQKYKSNGSEWIPQ